MNKERFWPRALGTLSIVALVLVTNEGYRHVRSLVDAVNQSKNDIAVLKRDLYVLQVQLDHAPVAASTHATGATPVLMNLPAPTPVALPMPAPIGHTPALPAGPTRPPAKLQSNDDTKSMLNVVLMSDAKLPATSPASPGTAKPAEASRIDVKLVGDPK